MDYGVCGPYFWLYYKLLVMSPWITTNGSVNWSYIYIYIYVITTIAGTRHDSTKNLLKRAWVKITTKGKIYFFCWKKHEWSKSTNDGLKEVLLLGLEGVVH